MVSITVEKHPDLESLQKAVSKAGKFTIIEQSAKQGHNHSDQRYGVETIQDPKKPAHLMHKDIVNIQKLIILILHMMENLQQFVRSIIRRWIIQRCIIVK